MKFKFSAIELLEVLLEETDKLSQDLARRICLDVHVVDVTRFMEELWGFRKIPALKGKANQILYRAYHVLCKMRDYQPQLTEDLFAEIEELERKSIDDPMEIMWLHFKRWSHSIEVNYTRDKGKPVLTKVYFPYDPNVRLHGFNNVWNYYDLLLVCMYVCVCLFRIT